MSIIAIAVWFAVYGVNAFWPFKNAGKILGIVAIVVAVAIVIQRFF